MSIPPLVCSTPPPPDQCEDEGDGDFDLQYNMPQEYDENNDDYDFTTFSTFDNFHTSENKQPELHISQIINDNNNSVFEKNIIKNKDEPKIKNLKCDEDPNVEDLNLIVDQEPLPSNVDKTESCECSESDGASLEEKVSETSNNVKIEDVNESNIVPDEPVPKSQSNEEGIVIISVSNVIKDEFENTWIKKIEGNASCDESIKFNDANDVIDDFGAFDDFEAPTTSNKPISDINNWEDPWNNEESNFTEFKANFEDTNAIQNPELQIDSLNNSNATTELQLPDLDDDFGDFDDFKSSHETKILVEDQQLPVFNLQSSENEHQVIETINNLLSTIFSQEVPVDVREFEGKLDTLLCETWGHLVDIDIRQPYIINWNNSIGQKALLKSLCIDSRNILFSSKWSYRHTPKYAANLTNAPLQPQKSVTSTTQHSDSILTEKSATKAEPWTDPFTSDGQESCNKENENIAAETRPSDIYPFENPEKSDKIYSKTPSVQPLRHINLPDTHIFTPSDSKTPRSKTIHYNSPTVGLPQNITNNKNQLDKFSDINQISTNDVVHDEFSDFEEFKGSCLTNPLETKTENVTTKAKLTEAHSFQNTSQDLNITYQSQILQPIKIEPTIPVVNWPDPGEVKETYNDFSDFISNSSWNNDNKDALHATTLTLKDSSSTTTDKAEINGITNNKQVTLIQETNSGVDDDFDTFQSALPTFQNTLSNFNKKSIVNKNTELNEPKILSTSKLDYLNVTSKIDGSKSDNISVSDTGMKDTASSESIKHQTSSFLSNKNDKPEGFNDKNSPLRVSQFPLNSNNILQPTQVNTTGTTQIQQKAGQILQPLTLESYSQINWPNPGIDLQDLSRFNPVESLQSFKNDVSGNPKASPIHSQKNLVQHQDEDIWGDFVSSKPKQSHVYKNSVDDDEWTDFVSSSSVKPQNGLNTISLNVHTNLNMQKSAASGSKFLTGNSQIALDIPSLNYITPKSSNSKTFNERQFQNL